MGILRCIPMLFLIYEFQNLRIFFTAIDNSASSSDAEVAAAFVKFKISPDNLPVPPNHFLHVVFPGCHVVDLGNKLTSDEAAFSPTVWYHADPDSYYTLFMVDFDAFYPEFLNTPGAYLHWGVGNIKGCDVSSGKEFAPYLAVTLPPGSSPHRYIQLVYKQNGTLDYGLGDVIFTTVERISFDLLGFVAAHNLGNPQFGNFFIGVTLESVILGD